MTPNLQPLLILDCHFLCYRAWHTMKQLEHKGKATGVIYGFLRSISDLKDEFQTDRVAFCFEHKHLFRRDAYPSYKAKRKREMTEEEEAAYWQFKQQIIKLRKEYLPRIGFKNVFRVKGMESDDLMAEIAFRIPDDEEAILVTSDSDLWQCLRPNVRIYCPNKKKMLTGEKFVKKWGLIPTQWVWVKAIAGCKGDNVQGVPGVGDITALKYLTNKLETGSNAYQLIKKHWHVVVRNLKLVKLPYEGCPDLEIQEDELSNKGWRDVCDELGMRSIRSMPPKATRVL